GADAFENAVAYNGSVFKLKEHVERLYASAHAMMLNIPITQKQMIDAVVGTLRRNNLKDAYIRLVVTRGVGDLGLDPRKCSVASVIIITDRISLHEGEAKIKGITTLISWIRRDPWMERPTK
ncbi:MAG: aminotransferase class IV, partial [Candidatus Bathyarchaeia archaeon]